MTRIERAFSSFIFFLLSATLVLGLLSAVSYLFPETLKAALPFQQLRPMHVSAALFWIISGGLWAVLFHNRNDLSAGSSLLIIRNISIGIWCISILAVFGSYFLKKFGGREYWEFPPWLMWPIVCSWTGFLYCYFNIWKKLSDKRPQYLIMWITGMLFMLITFLEQNLYLIPWFRENYIRELTVQWKANGSMVGAWNQMIYGTSFYLMVKLSGNPKLAFDNKAIAFYFLGFANLLFNWGHHIYNVPTVNWMRHTAYAISMTEWILFIHILRNFRKGRNADLYKRYGSTYRFIIASEYWVIASLFLALFMSIPAFNRFSHGTHITVAHAMGATIGINTMILLASFSYSFKMDENCHAMSYFNTGFKLIHTGLSVFWISLIIAGIVKGYYQEYLHESFLVVSNEIRPWLLLFVTGGCIMITGFVFILPYFFKNILSPVVSVSDTNSTKRTDKAQRIPEKCQVGLADGANQS